MKRYFPFFAFLLSFFITLNFYAVREIYAGGLPSKEIQSKYDQAFKSIDWKKHNKSIDTSKYDVVILNFWASWCGPCIQEFPSLNKFYETYKNKKVLIIGLNADTENQKKLMNRAIKEHKLKFLNIADNGSIRSQFNVSAVPVSLFFHKGSLFKVSKGEENFMSSKYTQLIDKHLGQ